MPPDLLPVATLKRPAHRGGSVANPLEAVEDVAVAIDVALGDLPVVGAGVARRARVSEDDATFELVPIHVEADAPHAIGAKLDRRDAAVKRRPIILHAGGHSDRLTLHVHRHLQQMFVIRRSTRPAGERSYRGDCQR